MADKPCMNIVNPPGSGPVIRNDQGAGAGAGRDLIEFQASTTEKFSVDSNGLPDPGGGDPKRAVTINIGDIVADSDAIEHFLVKFPAAVTMTNAYISVDTSTADGTTNKQTISIKRSADDGEVYGFTTAANNPGVTLATWTTLGAAGNTAIVAGSYLYVDYTKTSAGLAMSGLTFLIEYTLAG